MDWSNTGSFVRELTVHPGKFTEVRGKRTTPSTVAWAFDTDVPTEFNLHFHEGKQVEPLLDRRFSSGLRCGSANTWRLGFGSVARLA